MSNLTTVPNPPGEGPGAQDPTNPFSMAELTAPGPKRRVRSQPVILMIVVGVSAAAIFGMRQYVLRTGIVLAEVNIDYKAEDAEKARTYERIMGDLQRAQTPLDIALKDFGQSPFMLDMGETKVDAPAIDSALTEAQRAEAEAKLRAQQREEELNSMVNAMTLHSIVGGRTPLARINEDTVSVGSVVQDTFKVVEIDGRSVVLEADGKRFTLTMEVVKPNAKRPAAKIGKSTAPATRK